MKNVNQYLFNYGRSVDNLCVSASDYEIDRWIRDDLYKGLTSYIAEGIKVQTHKREYSTEYRASVYVINPDDFWRIVQEEAIRMNRYMGGRDIV